MEHSFDVIGISETKLSDSSKINGLSLSGYTLHYQPTKLFCGGAAIYVNNKLDHFLRNELSICQKEFETICTEIKCNRNKDILCFCIYRHPNTDQEKFLQFLDSVLQKVAKEKKIASIMGDFNFDLLNYATDNNTFDFLNTIVESGFLPLIHQPTRIIETTGTLIDNIFSNNFEHETLSGNLLIKISDHLPQFAVVKRSVDISKATKYHKHDYKNF